MAIYRSYYYYNITLAYSSNGGGTAPASSTSKHSGTTSTAGGTSSPTITVASAPSPPTGKHFTSWSASWPSNFNTNNYVVTKGSSASSGGTLAFSVRCQTAANRPPTATISGTVTLTANWAWNTYAVNFYGNGATSGSTAAQTKTYGQNLTLRANGFAKTGYTFIGWNTNSGATTAQYANGATYTGNAAINLYAIWRKQLTLSYNANNGSGAPGAQSAYVYNSTTSYKFTLPSTRPTRTGYNFLGWSTSSTATSASYQPGGTITISANTALYAVWQLITYPVSYNSNGGSGTISNQTKNYGQNLTLSDGSGFTRALHTLTGWNTAANGSGTAYGLSGTYSANASLALFAQWHLDYLKPTILTLDAYRVASATGTEKTDDGQYIRVEATYVNSSYMESYLESTLTISIGGTTVHTATVTGASGSVALVFGTYSKDVTYEVELTIEDTYGSSTSEVVVPTAIYPIDLYGGVGTEVYMGIMHPYVAGQTLTTSDVYVDGDIKLLIDDTAGAGTLDGDLYDALYAMGWID